MPAKIYQRILQIGLLASLLMVLFVFKDLLFPYITSKQLPFNILMEVLFIFWVVFMLRYPAYRPKKSLITYGLLAYFAAILISCFVGVNFTLSFWGNAERMLGFFPVLHFLIFYLILITVIRTQDWWEVIFGTSIVLATVISFIGLFGPEVYSRIGNTAYVSGYLIFNLYFCLILFFRNRYKVARWFYLLPIIPMLFEFRACHTSGAIIGLFISILLMLFLFGLFHQKKALRRTSLISLAVVVILVGAVFSQYQAAWFQNSFLRNLTSQKSTFQTRLISWKGAIADFPSHPVFGTGFGNYAIIFDKHFDPKFFNYTQSETYFDRAHNNVLDILSTTGALGLLAYLSIFVAVFYYLWRLFKRHGRYAGTGEEPARLNLEIIIITSLLVAYFIQNLAVFDSFITYIGLMLTLGYIYWLVQEDKEKATGAVGAAEESTQVHPLTVKSTGPELIILAVLLIAVYIFTVQANVKPWQMFQGAIVGYGNIASGNYETGMKAYRQALVGTPLDHDARVTLINLIASNASLMSQLSVVDRQADLDYVIGLAQKNVAMNPQDSLMQMQLAQVLDVAARYNYQNNSVLYDGYSKAALMAIDRSIAASPGRIPVYLIKARLLLLSGQNAEALQVTNYAISLNPDYYKSYCSLAQFYLILKDDKNTAAPLNKCLDMGSGDISDFGSLAMLQAAITFEASHGDYARALLMTEGLAQVYSSNGEVWFNLAKLYLMTGNKTQAQLTAQEADSLDPQWGTAWADFLSKLPGASSTVATTTKK